MFIALFAIALLSGLAGATVGTAVGWMLRGRASEPRNTIMVNMEKLRTVPLTEKNGPAKP